MLDAAPDFPLPVGALLPLISQVEQRDINDFTLLWSGEAAALARDLPGQWLTAELGEGCPRAIQAAGLRCETRSRRWTRRACLAGVTAERVAIAW
jgi:hypothetical protein